MSPLKSVYFSNIRGDTVGGKKREIFWLFFPNMSHGKEKTEIHIRVFILVHTSVLKMYAKGAYTFTDEDDETMSISTEVSRSVLNHTRVVI